MTARRDRDGRPRPSAVVDESTTWGEYFDRRTSFVTRVEMQRFVQAALADHLAKRHRSWWARLRAWWAR